MKYNIMIGVLLVAPISYCAYDTQSHEIRIRELEEARFQKETEISRLNCKILEESRPYFECIDEALFLWIPFGGQDKKDFYKFINDLTEKLNNGDDIIAIIEENPNIEHDVEDADFMMLRYNEP